MFNRHFPRIGRRKVKIGQRVFVQPKNTRRRSSIRVVEQLYANIAGGVRLNREYAGFVSWNTEDLLFAGKEQ